MRFWSSVACALVLCAAPVARAGERPFWERIAAPERERFDGLLQQSRDLLQRANDPAAAEKNLRDALALERGVDSPADFDALLLLALIQSARGHAAQAVETLERAEAQARLPGEKADCWFRLGVERSKLGRYADALGAYERELVLGSPVGTPYANAAELLMALGRLGEAEERYRDAIRVDEQVGDRRAREHDLALSYYGLGVALDRDEQPVAAREMVGRAMALDPNGSKLRLAQQPGADVFFIPEGEVYYYLGLAAEVGGHAQDAEAAFREFLAHQPKSRWDARARAHVDALALANARPPRGFGGAGAYGKAGRRWRTLAVGTVSSKGPLPAPLIDAAWKHHPPAIEACLDPVEPPAGQDSVRVIFDVEIDAHGVVARAAAVVPAPFDADADPAVGAAITCMEGAVQSGLLVARPEHGKPTLARVEVLLAGGLAKPDPGRL